MVLKMKKRLKSQRGFTLIELLAVIVILGIIAAIAVPAVGSIIDKAENDAEVADALQIINAAKLAQAAGVEGETDNTWTESELEEYLTKASTFTSVSYDPDTREYTITGHSVGDMTESELLELEEPSAGE